MLPAMTDMATMSRSRSTHVASLWRDNWIYLLSFFIALWIVAGFTGYLIWVSRRQESAAWQARQANIADSKTQILRGWLQERRGDAQLQAERPSIQGLVARVGGGPATELGATRRNEVAALLDEVAKAYDYAAIYTLDAQGHLVCQSSEAPEVDRQIVDVGRSVVRSAAYRIDFFAGESGNSLLGFSAPIRDPEAPPLIPTGRPPPVIGVIILVSDPTQTIFPLLKETVPTRTGETVIMRRDGDEAVFLTALRHIPIPKAGVRRPLNTKGLAARAALEGRETFGEFIDYRGIPVLAATRHIPETGWGLVSKVDRDEALEHFQQMAWAEGISAVLLLGLIGGVLWGLRRQVVTRVLRKESEKFRALIEAAPDAVVIVEPGGRIALVNSSAESMFGYARGELLGQPVEVLVPERFRARHRQACDRFFSDPSVEHMGPAMGMSAVRKDGSEFPIEAMLGPIETGDVLLVSSSIRDVTDRKQAEEALRKSEASLTEAQRIAHLGTWDWDLGSDRAWWSDEMWRIFGVDPATFTPTLENSLRCIHPEDRESVQVAVQEALGSGKPYDTEYRIIRPDGTERVLQAQGNVNFDEAGRPVRMLGILHDITQHRRAQEALVAEREKFNNILNVLPAYIVLLTPDYHVPFANRFFRERFGESHGRRCYEYLFDRNEPCEICETYTVLKTLAPHRWEWTGPDGRDYDISDFPFTDTDGSTLILEMGIDITERKRAEAALRESELKNRTLFETASDAILLMRRDRFIDCNARTLKMFGCRRDQIIGAPPYKFSPPTQPDGCASEKKALEKINQALTVGPQFFEWEHCREDGTPFPAEVSLNRLELGGETLLQAIVRDITERQRVEKALRESEHQLTLVYTNVSDIIYYLAVEPEGQYRFVSVNPAFLRATGLAEDQVVGKLIQEVIPEPSRSLVLEKYEEAIRVKETLRWEEATPYPAGLKYGEVSITPVFDSAGRCTNLIGTVHDITERKQAEEAIHKLNQELEQRVRERTVELEAANKELEAFTYSVSHDLRAPLRHIDGFARLLLEHHQKGLADKGKHYLGQVCAAARQMGMLIDELLSLSRIGRQEVRWQVAGFNSLVREVVKDLKPQTAGRRIEWKIGDLPFVECDPALLKVVFVNLLSNAVKYTRPRERALIEVSASTENGHPVIAVRDNGVGFSMKYADKLFGVFQRLHRQEDFEGTGVGLATVQRIIHKHRGRIWAEAELNQGATFRFALGTPEARAGTAGEANGGRA